MARRRKRKVRRASARPRAAFRVKQKRSSRKSGGVAMSIGGAMLYGLGRAYVADFIAPVTNKLPFGDVADEIGMGALSWYLSKRSLPILGSVPVLKKAANAGLMIESARLGSYIGQRIMSQTNGTTIRAGVLPV